MLRGRALIPGGRPWELRPKAHGKGPFLTLVPRGLSLGMGFWAYNVILTFQSGSHSENPT